MKTNFCILAFLALFVFSACKSESKAYKEAMTSNDVEVLKDYLNSFPDAPQEHFDSVDNRCFHLSLQDALYSTMTAGVDIVASYEAAETYIASYPNGYRVAEVKSFIENKADEYKEEYDRRLVQQYEARYGEFIKKYLVNFSYRYKSYTNDYVFGAPDMNGVGYALCGHEVYKYEIDESNNLTLTEYLNAEIWRHDKMLDHFSPEISGRFRLTYANAEDAKKDGWVRFGDNGEYCYKFKKSGPNQEIGEKVGKFKWNKITFSSMFKSMFVSTEEVNDERYEQFMHSGYDSDMQLLESAKSFFETWK